MSNTTLSLAFMSGKGGVGKTNLTLNIGLALAEEAENNTLILDADMGLANLDVLLGLTPELTLQDIMLARRPVEDAVLALTPNLHILPSASGSLEGTVLNERSHAIFFAALNAHLQKYENVLLDLGAGIHSTVTEFARLVAARIVIVTPEPTSLTDAYALIKVLATNHGESQFFIVVNQVENAKEEAFAFERLNKACQHFLNIEPVLLGSVRYDKHFGEAIRKQEAFIRMHPNSKAANDIRTIAKRIGTIRERMAESLASRLPLQIVK